MAMKMGGKTTGSMAGNSMPKSKGMGHSKGMPPKKPCPCDSQPKPYQPKGK